MQKANQEPGSDLDVDLRKAMEQVSIISEVLCDIQHHYQAQVRMRLKKITFKVTILTYSCAFPLSLLAGKEWDRRRRRPVPGSAAEGPAGDERGAEERPGKAVV